MNKERIEMIKAMETIARSVNDEEIFDFWLQAGVPDGLFNGDLSEEEINEELEEFYGEDKEFADLMAAFCRLMRYMINDNELDKEDRKNGNGMLYSDRVVSKREV